MIFWLNRRVERAIESYLKTIVSGSLRVYRSADMVNRQFPCAVIRAHQNRRFTGEVYACNKMYGSIIVMTEFAHVVGSTAKIVEKFEEIEEAAVSSVLAAVYVDDLAAQLEATKTDGITISYAVPGSDEDNPVTSQSAEVDGVSQVEIPLTIMAGAKEL